MRSSCRDPMRCLGNIVVRRRLGRLMRPWLASVVWSTGVLGCCLALLLPGLGQAAEQAELEYAKGIVEYGKGNYPEALEHFRSAVDLAPADANAHLYLGLTQSRLGEFGAAIPPLEKALQLDPSMQYAHYHLGLAFFQEQRYPEALRELQRAAQFDPNNAAVHFYLGYTLYQLKRYREALPPFERALQLDPALATSVQYYRGLALFALENDAQARAAFEAAQAADPTSTIGQNAARYLAALKARERDRRLWQVEGSASLQYDSNVLLEGNLPSPIAISRKADGSTVYNATGRVFAIRTPMWQAGGEYDFFQSLHFTLHDFDIRSHTFGLFGRVKLEPVTLRLGVNYNLIDLNNARFSESYTVQPSATLQETQDLFTLISVQYRSDNYYHDVPPGQDPAVRGRSGWDVRTGFDQFWLFNKQRSYARLSYHYDTQRSQGSDWDYNGHEVGLGVQTPLWAGITLDVSGSYYRFDYQNVNSFSCCTDARGGLGILDSLDTRVRTDNRFTGGIALSRTIGPYFTLSAGYVRTGNHSNLAFFDYRRNLVTLAITGRF
jgi:Flp pilus assembly protein TadD/opacity protein-like surface antigen